MQQETAKTEIGRNIYIAKKACSTNIACSSNADQRKFLFGTPDSSIMISSVALAPGDSTSCVRTCTNSMAIDHGKWKRPATKIFHKKFRSKHPFDLCASIHQISDRTQKGDLVGRANGKARMKTGRCEQPGSRPAAALRPGPRKERDGAGAPPWRRKTGAKEGKVRPNRQIHHANCPPPKTAKEDHSAVEVRMSSHCSPNSQLRWVGTCTGSQPWSSYLEGTSYCLWHLTAPKRYVFEKCNRYTCGFPRVGINIISVVTFHWHYMTLFTENVYTYQAKVRLILYFIFNIPQQTCHNHQINLKFIFRIRGNIRIVVLVVSCLFVWLRFHPLWNHIQSYAYIDFPSLFVQVPHRTEALLHVVISFFQYRQYLFFFQSRQ